MLEAAGIIWAKNIQNLSLLCRQGVWEWINRSDTLGVSEQLQIITIKSVMLLKLQILIYIGNCLLGTMNEIPDHT